MYESKLEKGTQEGGKESQGRSGCEMQPDACKEETEKKAFDGVVCQWQIQGLQRRMESRTSTTLRGSVYGS